MDFHKWLRLQEDRQDEIGELARILLPDTLIPFWSNRLATYRAFVIYRNPGKRLQDALERAFVEWRQACQVHQ